jgi:Ca-activated chloride channel family protein
VSPLTAAEAAKTLGYRVYTIGTGTRGLAPYPVKGPFGNTVYQPMQVSIDEDTLQRIADETGGRYFRATDTESLEGIYEEIDELEKSPQEALQYLDYQELYPGIALLALLLLVGESILAETWLRVLP